jgi:hypothetical protein
MARLWIEANPGKAAALYAAKLLHYFSSNDRLATAGEGSALRTVVATVAYLPLLLTLMIRPFVKARYPWKPVELLIFALYLSNALLAAVFFTRVRLRLPADFMLLPVLGGLVGALCGGRLSRSIAHETG